MKTKKNFLKKLTAGILGFVMTLGVGAAGYSASVGETRAASVTYKMTPDNNTTGSTSTGYVSSDTTFTKDDVSWKIDEWNPSNMQIRTNKGATEEFRICTTTAFPGYITKVVFTFSALTLSNTTTTGMRLVPNTATTNDFVSTGGADMTWNSIAKTLTWNGAASSKYRTFSFYQNGKVATGTNKLASTDAIVVTYEPITTGYAISYNDNKPDDASGSVGNMPTNETASTISSKVPTLSGYTFDGWATSASGNVAYQPGASISAAVDLYAHWTPIQKYTLSYSLNGAQGTPPAGGSYSNGTSITLPANPSWTGYRFLGWKRSDNNQVITSSFNMPANDLTLTAQWAQLYNLSYSLGEASGTAPSGGSYISGETVTLPSNPTWTGYNFVGWSRDDGLDNITGASFRMPANNLTLTAQWEEKVAANFQLLTGLSDISTSGTRVIIATRNVLADNNGTTYLFNNVSSGHATSEEYDSSTAEDYIFVATKNSSGTGFTLYRENYGFLYCSKASSGGLSWHDTETSYWNFDNDGHLLYHGMTNSRIRVYQDKTFRCYGNDSGSGNPYIFFDKVATKLNPPTITGYSNETLSWSSVTGAGSYKLRFDNRTTGTEYTASGTSYSISSIASTLGAGDHYAYIKSVKDSSGNYKDSDYSTTGYKFNIIDFVPEVTSIDLSTYSMSKEVGDSPVTITATVKNQRSEAMTGETVSWSSNNTDVATVTSSGQVSFVGRGSATITATSDSKNSVTASCSVTVHNYFTVSFNAGEGSGSMSQLTNQEVLQSAPACTFTAPTDSRFSKWKIGSALGEDAVFPLTLNSNITLYAVYSAIDYKYVTYNANGGEGTMTQGKVENGQPYEIAANEFTYTGYGFAGWKDGQGNDYVVGQSYTITSDLTLFAQWESASSYELVTSESELATGDTLIFVGVKDNSYYAISPYASGNNFPSQLVDDPIDGVITIPANTGNAQITLGGEKDSWTFNDGTYYLYAAGGNASKGNNYMKGTTELNSTSYWKFESIDSGTGAAVIDTTGSTTRPHMRFNPNGTDNPIFSCYGSGQSDIYVYKKISTTPTIALNTTSVEGMKGTANENITLTCTNFSPEIDDISFEYSVQNVCVVSATSINDGVYSLSVSFTSKNTSTIVTISVDGAEDSVGLSVSTIPQPASITSNFNESDTNYINKLATTALNYKDLQPVLKDSEGDTISGQTKDLFSFEVEPDNDHIFVSENGRVYSDGGESSDDVTITITCKSLDEVSISYTVRAISDYNNSVKSITPINGVEVTQGEPITLSNHISASSTGTYFKQTSTIQNDEYRFSYDSDGTNLKSLSEFAFDIFEDGEFIDPTADLRKQEQTIYVYTTFTGSDVKSQFTVIVTEADNPVTGIAIHGVTNHAMTLDRGSEQQLTIDYTPEHPTSGKTVTYTIDSSSSDEGHGISVTPNGYVTVGTDPSYIGKHARIIATAGTTENPVTDYVDITVTREAQTVHAFNDNKTWNLVTNASDLKAGDILVLASNADRDSETSGIQGRTAGDISSSVMGSVESTFSSDLSKITLLGSDTVQLKLGGVSGAWTFENSDGEKLGSTAVKKVAWDNGTTTWSISIDNETHNATIQNGTETYGRFLYNVGSPRFIPYTSATSATMVLPQLYKLNDESIDEDLIVEDELFNAAVQANALFDGGITSAEWSQMQGILSGFSQTSSSTILHYGVANAAGNEVEQLLANYDLIIATTEYTNFLHRSEVVTHTVTIDYNHDGQTETVTALEGDYRLPVPAEYTGYDFQGWTINGAGKPKQAGSVIQVTADITITANWVKGLSFESDIGFKFTGLSMEKFQLVFNGSAPEGAISYGYLYTTTEGFDLTSVDIDDVKNGEVSEVRYKENTERLSLNTSDGNKEVTVIFYWYDSNGVLHYSDPITISFNDYVTSESFDINSITDKYARAALEAYLRSLKNNENQGE